MQAPLVFHAAASGRVFGMVEVRNGQATARVAGAELRRVLFGHALMWLRRQSPAPEADVEFRLVIDERP